MYYQVGLSFASIGSNVGVVSPNRGTRMEFNGGTAGSGVWSNDRTSPARTSPPGEGKTINLKQGTNVHTCHAHFMDIL